MVCISSVKTFVLVMFVSCFAAVVVWHLVEKHRIERLGDRHKRDPLPGAHEYGADDYEIWK